MGAGVVVHLGFVCVGAGVVPVTLSGGALLVESVTLLDVGGDGGGGEATTSSPAGSSRSRYACLALSARRIARVNCSLTRTARFVEH